MPGKMVSVPAIKGWCDVHGPVNERCGERDRKGKKSKRNIAQGKGKCKGVERTRGEPRQRNGHEEQAVVVDEWKEHADYRKCRCCKEQNSPRSDQTAEIHGEGPDEHQAHVGSGAKPRAGIEANSEVAFEVCQPKGNHAAGQRDRSRSYDDPKNP